MPLDSPLSRLEKTFHVITFQVSQRFKGQVLNERLCVKTTTTTTTTTATTVKKFSVNQRYVDKKNGFIFHSSECSDLLAVADVLLG